MSYSDCKDLRYNGASEAHLTYHIICVGEVPIKFERMVEELIGEIEGIWGQMAPILCGLYDGFMKYETNGEYTVFAFPDDLECVASVTLQLSIRRRVDNPANLVNMLQYYFEERLQARLGEMIVDEPTDLYEEEYVKATSGEQASPDILAEDPPTHERAWVIPYSNEDD